MVAKVTMRGPPSPHDFTPASSRFAHSARHRARRVAAMASRRSRRFRLPLPTRWAASPPRCRRSPRIRRMISPPADGWALRARDLVGASSYSPLPLATSPVWVEAGDPMPEGCDCVLDSDSVDQTGPMLQVLAEAIPGQGVRRAGGDIAGGTAVVEAGRRVLPRDLLIARAAGLQRLSVRRPRLRIVNVPATGTAVTAQLIAESARKAGADVVCVEAAGRDAASIAGAIDAGGCDLLLTVGGSGVGRTDATVTALAQRGEVIAHGIALQPGRTTAVGRIGKTPVIALQGAPDQAFAAWWTLALPVLDRLSGRRPRQIAQPAAGAQDRLRRRHRRDRAAAAKAGRLGHAGGRRSIARCDRPRRSLARGTRRRRRFCCGRAGRWLYAAGMIRALA